MDKLFKLLKQSAEERWMAQRWSNLWEYLSYSGRYKNESELVMISERYGFIDWLCNNWKINREDEYLKRLRFTYFDYSIEDWSIDHSRARGLIMLLSIQEKPVELLIDLLK